MNAGSGSKDAHNKVSQLKNAFTANKLSVNFYLVSRGSSVADAVRRAKRYGHNVIVAVGGDGTLNAVASHLLNTEIPLGIIPMGTFNHLARDLNIPADIDAAIKVLAQGKPYKIDVGKVNDRIFLNNSSIGLYSKLVHYREEHQRSGYSKRAAIIIAIASVFKKYSFLNVEVEVGDHMESFKPPLIFVGNNEYDIEGFDLGSRLILDEGLLGVYVIKHAGKWNFIKLCFRSLLWQGLGFSDSHSKQPERLFFVWRGEQTQPVASSEQSVFGYGCSSKYSGGFQQLTRLRF